MMMKAIDNFYLQGCIEDQMYQDLDYVPKHPEEYDPRCYKKVGDRALCIICNCSILWLTDWNIKAHTRSNKHIANCKARIAYYNRKMKLISNECGPKTWMNRGLEDTVMENENGMPYGYGGNPDIYAGEPRRVSAPSKPVEPISSTSNNETSNISSKLDLILRNQNDIFNQLKTMSQAIYENFPADKLPAKNDELSES